MRSVTNGATACRRVAQAAGIALGIAGVCMWFRAADQDDLPEGRRRPMFSAPKDGRWIEIGGLLGGGSAYAFWTGTYWDDGAGYIVEGTWWRPCPLNLPLPAPPPARSGDPS